MLPFPQPRPTGRPASSSPWRASPDSSYETASPTSHSSFEKTLPPLPAQQKESEEASKQTGFMERSANPSESRTGFKWWWKTGGRREAERRKSLGIGSSRTSYQVEDLSSGLQGIDLGHHETARTSARSGASDHHLVQPHALPLSQYARKRRPPPPPIPPRPEQVDLSIREPPAQKLERPRKSPTKLYRKYQPPPKQVPPYAPDVFSSQAWPPGGHRSLAHVTHSHSQPTFHQTRAQPHQTHQLQPCLPHSYTTSDIHPPKTDHQSTRPLQPYPLHSHPVSTPPKFKPSALSPTHRDNLVGSPIHHYSPTRRDDNVFASNVCVTPVSNRTTNSNLGTPVSAPNTPARNAITGSARQCSGFTRQGRRCKRMVKTASPYAALVDGRLEIVNKHSFSFGSPSSRRSDRNDADEGVIEEEPRYCRDHVKQICEAEGFYWKGQRGEKWIKFSDWIPEELEEQSKVLLRLTMESALTSRECEGYIYAYELRDLQTSTTAFYKVGRTDNVPRRLDEWKKRCTSHHPTLRDVFPLHDAGPGGSMLPGAMGGGIGVDGNSRPTCPAVKRLERLIHIELAAHAAQSMGNQTGRRRYDCADCQTSHQEIFPIASSSGWEYERVVKTAIMRWEAFVREIVG